MKYEVVVGRESLQLVNAEITKDGVKLIPRGEQRETSGADGVFFV